MVLILEQDNFVSIHGTDSVDFDVIEVQEELGGPIEMHEQDLVIGCHDQPFRVYKIVPNFGFGRELNEQDGLIGVESPVMCDGPVG